MPPGPALPFTARGTGRRTHRSQPQLGAGSWPHRDSAVSADQSPAPGGRDSRVGLGSTNSPPSLLSLPPSLRPGESQAWPRAGRIPPPSSLLLLRPARPRAPCDRPDTCPPRGQGPSLAAVASGAQSRSWLWPQQLRPLNSWRGGGRGARLGAPGCQEGLVLDPSPHNGLKEAPGSSRSALPPLSLDPRSLPRSPHLPSSGWLVREGAVDTQGGQWPNGPEGWLGQSPAPSIRPRGDRMEVRRGSIQRGHQQTR